jgi:CRP/FNR family transcriptional regulator
MEHSNDRDLVHLRSGQTLFRSSGPKQCAYKVLRGSLALYQPRPAQSDEPIRFAFPGDVVGLGFLAHHAENALAISDSLIDCLSSAELEVLLVRDERVRDELDAATEREFEYQRRHVTDLVRTPIMRTALLLLAASSDNRGNGFDPLTVELPARDLAGLAGLSPADMDNALLDLESTGLIEASILTSGVRLLRPMLIQAIADNGCLSTSASISQSRRTNRPTEPTTSNGAWA